MRLQFDERDVDVEGRTLHFRMNTVASAIELKIYAPEGKLLHQSNPDPGPHDANDRLKVGWPDLGKQGVNFRLEMKVTSPDGYWTTVEVVRFYMEIPHKDVVFASGSWDIAANEAVKLVEPLKLLKGAVKRYGKIMDVRIYVAGYTDTVGSPAANQTLSEQRARAIARYFASHGLRKVPIHVRGFGEGAPLVKTADDVDEPRNRRVQYIISTFTPAVAGPGSWQRVR